MQKEVILGVARHALTAAGTVIAARGVMETALVNEAVGALMVLISVGWSTVEKRRRRA